MLKHLLASISLIVTIGLFPNTKLLLAQENPLVTNNNTQNTKTQLTRLEISLSRRQLTLYQNNTLIKSYPVAVGKAGWETPRGNFQVIDMRQNPKWINPLTGEAILGGDPENPLGNYWIGFWTNGTNWVGMHGTPTPNSVGKAVSHGCVRMHNKDIQELFAKVTPGTPVKVVP